MTAGMVGGSRPDLAVVTWSGGAPSPVVGLVRWWAWSGGGHLVRR
ncbi:hypothetical protein ACTD5D_35775 [Nocardia takedensis]|nr:hypothetical protein [Nocardia takedensis]